MKKAEKRSEKKVKKRAQTNKRKVFEIFALAGIFALLIPIVCEGVHQKAKNAHQALAAGGVQTAVDGVEASPAEQEIDNISMRNSEKGMEGTETEPESETETEPESETETESESETESETETASENETETEPESETEAESEEETEIGSEKQPESEAESESEKTVGKETEKETETDAAHLQEHPEQTEDLNSDRLDAMDEPQDEQGGVQDIPNQPENETELSEETEDSEAGSLEESIPPDDEAETEGNSDENSAEEPEEETDNAAEPESQPNEIPESQKNETDKKKPKKIARGKHYDIVGDEGAYYRDQSDHLWIRAGSSLRIETKGKSRFDKAQGLNGLNQDGVFTFCLKKTDENGALLEQSELKEEQYFVDGEAPGADIAVDGRSAEGITYASDTARATVMVAPDGKSGLCSAAYRVIRCDADGRLSEDPEKGEWIACAGEQIVEIKEEGLFQVFVRTKDNVGNTNFSKSSMICVDHTPPQIRIEGVRNQSANSGPVKIRIEGSDANYKLGSLQVELIGKNGGQAPAVNRKKEMRDKAVLEFFDFPSQKGYDDIYSLCVKAEDMSGNISEKEVGFSVNRYGSVYALSEDTGRRLKGYFLSKAIPIVFYETNIDYVGESQIYCRRDGELQSLVKDKDYFVSMQGKKDSWKQYCYTVPAEYFDKEGIYELILASGDQAKNKSDTGIQKKQVAFVLDRTAPDCVITGIEEKQVYQEKMVTACLTPKDNTGIKSMKVYRNSKLILMREEFWGRSETIRVSLEQSDEWQTLQVFLQDGAGNIYWSREIPVFIGGDAQKAPKYKKVRASAQELEIAERAKKQAGNQMQFPAVRRIQKTKMQAAQGDGDSLSSGQLSRAISSRVRRTPEGMALLLFGAAVFVVTVVAYMLSSGKNTGSRK